MPSVHSTAPANILAELCLEQITTQGLRPLLEQVPWALRTRRDGLDNAQRCLCLLAGLSQGCRVYRDWNSRLHQDNRLQFWLDGRSPPAASTLSRSLAAATEQTVAGLCKVLGRLDQPLFCTLPPLGFWVLDLDSQGLPAHGKSYENAAYGHMPDGSLQRGYGLHLLSLENTWPLAMDFTPANADPISVGMPLLQRWLHGQDASLRRHLLLRGDSLYGCARFLRYLRHGGCGYLLKGTSPAQAQRLWREHVQSCPLQRIARAGQGDLLAIECGPQTLDGADHRQDAQGRPHRHRLHVPVPRVVVYQEDPAGCPPGQAPQCFCLLTTLERQRCSASQLLELYNQRGGTIENLFNQLEQAFAIHHWRSRRYWGNYSFLLLSLVAASLCQRLRQQGQEQGLPTPAGLQGLLQAAACSGLRLEQEEQAGCTLHSEAAPPASRPAPPPASAPPPATAPYTYTLLRLLHCSYQYCFAWAA